MGTRIAEKPVGNMRPGDHAVFSFTTAEEQTHVIGPFLHDGLDAHEKVIYISDAAPGRLPGLHSRPDANHFADTGQLRVIPQGVACLTRGRFDLDRMRTVIGREITLASEQSYRAVRITADMSWLLNEPCGFPLMLECEASFDETMGPSAAIMALCQLNRNYCPPDQLNELIHTHQLRVTANPEYDDGVLRIIRSLVPEGLQLIGELDAARHNPFMAALTSLGETNTAIHLDFTQVRFLDLGALSLLVTHAMRTPPDHILILDNLPPEVAGVIQTLGWHHLPGLTRGQPRRP